MRYFLLISMMCCYAVYADAQVAVRPGSGQTIIIIKGTDEGAKESGSEVPTISAEDKRLAELEAKLDAVIAQLALMNVEPAEPKSTTVQAPEPEMPKYAPYPTLPVRRYWIIIGVHESTPVLIHHLMTHPEHKGKFNREYLNYLGSLPQGNAMLKALHSDDHEGAVRWGYIGGEGDCSVQPIQSAKPAKQVRYINCPNGRCPNR